MKFLSLPLSLFSFFTLVFLTYTSLHGLSFPDEGYIVNTAQRILNYQVLYRDFDFVYTPLTAWLTALGFTIFGESILVERLFHLGLALVSILYLIKIGRLFTKNILLSFLPALFFIAWGPSHINFMAPGILVLEISIISLFYYLMGKKENNARSFFITGIGITLMFLTKQNFGAAFLLFCLCDIGISSNKKHIAVPIIKGFVMSMGIFFLYLLATNSLQSFIANMWVYSIERIILKNNLHTPFEFWSPGGMGKLLLYGSPLFLSVLTLWKNKKQSIGFCLGIFVLINYLIGLRPETDYVHLSPLLGLNGLAILPLLLQIKKAWQRYLLSLASLILFIIGIWSALFFGYYRWNAPLITQNSFVSNPHVRIWTDSSTEKLITDLTHKLDAYGEDKKIFINYYAPMFYFFLGRANPTRYDYTGLFMNYQAQAIQDLNNKEVEIVIATSESKSYQTALQEFINKNYRQDKKIQDHYIFVKN
ncbi:MAG: glycosyltransferase family 39 protein [Candidatus Levybacteria bacterium]|nr:glycosyltransferase family 39 protein [Candidatus Levybacteria bacterium]